MLATTLILLARVFLFEIVTVSNSRMGKSFCIDKKLVCAKFFKKKYDEIVLLGEEGRDSCSLKRLIAKPADTLEIRQGIVYLNEVREINSFDYSYNYSFHTDTLPAIYDYLQQNAFAFDYKKAYLGVLSGDIPTGALKDFESQPIYNIKRKKVEPHVSLLDNNSFWNANYWNKDNLGPIIVPWKGMKIKLGKRAISIYKRTIEAETGEKLILDGKKVFLGKKKASIYTFKKDYYFLMNDNRAMYNDSRTLGFVPEDLIIGAFLFKLPW